MKNEAALLYENSRAVFYDTARVRNFSACRRTWAGRGGG